AVYVASPYAAGYGYGYAYPYAAAAYRAAPVVGAYAAYPYGVATYPYYY
uniref:Cuticle protein 5.1 n=1 Tax=Locusta migratoria TaxID=7004 RepID=CU051_LOCMI|nr:RecName: Full=Cuticle protein 5.1; AltName: Full=LmNCP5.1 [Locusta migratoria]